MSKVEYISSNDEFAVLKINNEVVTVPFSTVSIIKNGDIVIYNKVAAGKVSGLEKMTVYKNQPQVGFYVDYLYKEGKGNYSFIDISHKCLILNEYMVEVENTYDELLVIVKELKEEIEMLKRVAVR